jgi:hypothetical protein
VCHDFGPLATGVVVSRQSVVVVMVHDESEEEMVGPLGTGYGLPSWMTYAHSRQDAYCLMMILFDEHEKHSEAILDNMCWKDVTHPKRGSQKHCEDGVRVCERLRAGDDGGGETSALPVVPPLHCDDSFR